MTQEEHATMLQGQGFLSLKRERGREGEKPGRRSSRYGRRAFPWFGHKGTCRSEVVYKNKSKGRTRMNGLEKNDLHVYLLLFSTEYDGNDVNLSISGVPGSGRGKVLFIKQTKRQV
jgi:hypothetical protein